MSDEDIRVRIAPSPSGYVHVGTARMAICNWLFARHHGGKFLVRIEDTDKERSKPEYIEAILDAFRWLGLDWDEGILRQSERLDHYGQFANQILDSGAGYRCFCTSEQLANDREEAKARKGPLQYNRRCLHLNRGEIDEKVSAGLPFTIRLRIPDGETVYDDIVSGKLTRQNKEIEDFIIARSDGSAVYNLAVVVDDHDMGITHVFRGNDHVTNTFKQVHIYQALGWEPPRFGHVPLILRPDKKKVSKRLGDKDVVAYRNEGILSEAMFNYLSLLGWSSRDDREIYNRNELVEVFTADNLRAANAIFDEEKLLALNGEHIRLKSDHELATMVAPMLVDAGLTSKYWLETRWEYLRAVISQLKSRVARLSDFVQRGGYYFSFEHDYDPEAEEKHFTPEAADRLEKLADRFDSLEPFSAGNLETTLNEVAEELEVKRGVLIHPTRLAVSGMSVGPSLYEMLELLGSHNVVSRMRHAVNYIKSKYTD